jgi:hypothetical protein
MERLRAAMAGAVQKAQKELCRDLEPENRQDPEDTSQAVAGGALAYAVYDQDVRSRQNQMVKKIDESPLLDQADKDNLMAEHQKGAAEVDKLLEAERQKQ